MKLFIITLISISSFLFTDEPYGGYILYTPGGMGQGNSTSYLRDVDGSVYNSWTHGSGPASMPYLLPDSSIIYPYKVQQPTMSNGGVGGGIQKISWDGTVIFDYILVQETLLSYFYNL